ncbi:hypothetical protein ABT096_39260 [Streptomyces sp. NPDC002561]
MRWATFGLALHDRIWHAARATGSPWSFPGPVSASTSTLPRG